MQITCPSCAATYEVPPTALKPGKLVRCARCAVEWAPLAATPEVPVAAGAEADSAASPQAASPTGAAMGGATATNVAPPAPEPLALRSVKPRPPARRRNVALTVAWAASILAILLLSGAAYAERSAIMQVWPPSIRLYAALGLAAGH